MNHKKKLTAFGELLETAARGYPDLWKDGKLNLSAVARLYARKGVPVPQATIFRNCFVRQDGSIQDPSEATIKATYEVFGVPLELLRRDKVPRRLEELLAEHPLERLLLAKRILSLDAQDRDDILRQVQRAEERSEEMRKVIERHPNVTPIAKLKR
jgi:hypothetical protein